MPIHTPLPVTSHDIMLGDINRLRKEPTPTPARITASANVHFRAAFRLSSMKSQKLVES